MSKQRFQGKVAVVTGGNSGIGFATAKAFVSEGARVAILGRDAKTLATAKAALGANAIAVQGDVARTADLTKLFDAVSKEVGRIDTLFVNAGMALFAPIEQVDEDSFEQQFATNVKGAYFTIQKALPLMARGSSIVINASAVIDQGMPNTSVYTATKVAIASLARSLSRELAARGIRLNIVNPGPIETPIYGRLGLREDEVQGMAKQIQGQVPLDRFGTSDEVARTVLFLASDEASFVHGTSIHVDGGMASL
ncbi:MAG: SDR family oxidoreductase [Planctomycetes bacterium]|nr:SDR family oxidoreductase [Planctomycetota bacterium]